jgi:hypothetical protein
MVLGRGHVPALVEHAPHEREPQPSRHAGRLDRAQVHGAAVLHLLAVLLDKLTYHRLVDLGRFAVVDDLRLRDADLLGVFPRGHARAVEVDAALDVRQLAVVVAAHQLQERLLVVHLLDPARHRDQPGLLGGELAVMAGEDLEAIPNQPHQQGVLRRKAVLDRGSGRKAAGNGCPLPAEAGENALGRSATLERACRRS